MTDQTAAAPTGALDAFPGLTAADLKSAGVETSEQIAHDAFARILLMGPAKVGKTTSIVTTAPRPYVINCDGISATKFAVEQGAKFLQTNVSTRAGWKKAVNQAVKWADEGKIRTIVVDTLTILVDDIEAECKVTLSGFELWNEVADAVQTGLRKLLKANAHVFVVCHMNPKEDNVAGLLPAMRGSTAAWLPGRVHDWVLFECDPDKPEASRRSYILGPQKQWTHSGRNIKRSCAVKADVNSLFAELGITP